VNKRTAEARRVSLYFVRAVDGWETITDGAGDAVLSFHTTVANLHFLPGSRKYPQRDHAAVLWDVTGGVIWNTTFDSTVGSHSEPVFSFRSKIG